MPALRRLDLPTGMTITLGCLWPGARWGAGEPGAREGNASRVGAHAAPRAGTEDILPARAQGDVGAVGRQADFGREVVEGVGEQILREGLLAAQAGGVPGLGHAPEPAEQQEEQADQQGVHDGRTSPVRRQGGSEA